jgi:hypothetical protein
MRLKVYERSAVSEFLGDRIVYRNLSPIDASLPGLAETARQVGLAPGVIPRKSQEDYARVVVRLLELARKLDSPNRRLKRLAFIGDTYLNDSTAFSNLCQAGGWEGKAFIGADRLKEAAEAKVSAAPGGGELYVANRWQMLADFDHYCAKNGFPFDEDTAVVVDLDKTALGGRGRNDQVIDQARVLAVRRTVAGLLGEAFDTSAFQKAYDLLKQMEFHPFTADNQDYLAYICLILGSGLYNLAAVVADVRVGRLVSFHQFIEQVQARLHELPAGLAQVHSDIYANVRRGDPTPFKPFRRNEYLETVNRLGHLPDETPLPILLGQEIVLTQEVRQQALQWKQSGALLFGLSDKPDEASLPTPEQAAQGYQALHARRTHAVGY